MMDDRENGKALEVLQRKQWCGWKTIGYEKIEPNDCDHYDGDARDSEGHVCDKCLRHIREERYSYTVADIAIIEAALKSNAEMRSDLIHISNLIETFTDCETCAEVKRIVNKALSTQGATK